MSRSQEHVRQTLQTVLQKFESGDIAPAVAAAVFPPPDLPMNRWSLMNRTLCFIAGTSDARGFRQWKQAGRHVKKGARAIHILAPRTIKVENDETGEEEHRLIGFNAVPVFRVEDTDGSPLTYQEPEVPAHPLLDVAHAWGVSISAEFCQGKYLGYFRPATRHIVLASPQATVFFHELAHAAHERVLRERGDTLKGGQDWKQEIVAELSATVLGLLYGVAWERSSGAAYRYIDSYARKAKKDVLRGCAAVLADVEKVLTLIVQTSTVSSIVA
ncbi:MAG: antirestriction protein [Candidatus Tectomicrobia bacterium]|nr:antirestriction protein [Candidatus Tectomicrobia bacterium]